jgi:hypothetical protein
MHRSPWSTLSRLAETRTPSRWTSTRHAGGSAANAASHLAAGAPSAANMRPRPGRRWLLAGAVPPHTLRAAGASQPGRRVTQPCPDDATPPRGFIIVRRDKHELYEHLRERDQGDARVEVIVDRRLATLAPIPAELTFGERSAEVGTGAQLPEGIGAAAPAACARAAGILGHRGVFHAPTCSGCPDGMTPPIWLDGHGRRRPTLARSYRRRCAQTSGSPARRSTARWLRRRCRCSRSWRGSLPKAKGPGRPGVLR